MGRIILLTSAFIISNFWMSNANILYEWCYKNALMDHITIKESNYGNQKDLGYSSSFYSFTKKDLVAPVAPTCPNPSQLIVIGTSSNSATIAWTENGIATKWMVRYGPTNFNPLVSGTMLPVSGSPTKTLNSLVSGTNYDFYIKAVCSKNLETGWIGPGKFTTACSSYSTIPYMVDFENAVASDVPVCTMTENLGYSTVDWETVSNPNLGFN